MIVNSMVAQLNTIANEVTRVSLEVGTQGIFGGQATVGGVQGMWKVLTDNVNLMAMNLTNQVRSIAQVTTAVAGGHSTKKITAEEGGGFKIGMTESLSGPSLRAACLRGILTESYLGPLNPTTIIMSSMSSVVPNNPHEPSWHSCPAEIHQAVISFLSVSQLMLLANTSRYNHAVVKQHIHGRVVDLLSGWTLPWAILDFMKEHDMIFSSSAILALLEPDCLTPNDLDAYVPLGGLSAAHSYLCDRTAYVQTQKQQVGLVDATDGYVSDGTADTGVNNVVFYRHSVTNTVLNIIETSHSDPTVAIFKFHSTFVMNSMTSNALVSAYPKMTADHVGLVNTASPKLSFQMVRCLLKYGIRGFETLERACNWQNADHDCRSYAYCARCRRTVGDRTTMRVAFMPGIGTTAEVIDAQLSWTLASRYDCTSEKNIDAEQGYVTPGDRA
ncbi:hypothetical protein EST38_g4877 [Candolleomyces aberdarensis]|uniref:F-box domain-containing protein n=1 Tax=Candolleomyces aberdarensis TaxID=2316362 RepID=A0A4Q2DPR6_9AGAR|nr:hypothetical protein EST38_g4877 [Candolleomyces aberdarensis]